MRPKLAKKQEPEYYLRLTSEAPEEGPFLIDELKVKAGAGEITREDWIRRSDEEAHRQVGEDKALIAYLWPDEEEGFDPANFVEGGAGETQGAPTPGGDRTETDPVAGDHGGNSADILEDNMARERLRRQEAGEVEEEGFDWRGLLGLKWVALRWMVAGGFLIQGYRMWPDVDADAEALLGFKAFLPFIAALLLIAWDLVRFLASPLTTLIDSLIEGSGGGRHPDYWTADSLMDQGEYRLATAEYRRIAMQYPRAVDAYLKGVKAARTLGNEKEVERFRELAMKNLKHERDRDAFLSQFEAME